MSELRTDPLTGRSALVAERRAGRPNDFLGTAREAVDAEVDESPRADCPFCPGNEEGNPEPTLYWTGPDGAGADGRWRLRVVPNKYPSVLPFGADSDSDALRGGHEVVIESPRHISHTSRLSVDELALVLRAYAERLAFWAREPRAAYRLVFKNVGPAGGASLRHLHSQIITLPEAPPGVAVELDNLRADHAATGDSPWGRWLDETLADGSRVVEHRSDLVACCPQVGRLPYETWLMPTANEPRFEDFLASPDRFDELASLLHRVLRFIEIDLAADYNLALQTAPSAPGVEDWYRWRMEIVPRIGSIAGFELPSGVYLNTVAPERAAERMRAAIAATVTRA